MKLLKLSVVIPCLNEAQHIVNTLNQLQGLRQRGHEVILSDGGSTDTTLNLSKPLVDCCIQSEPGRARQMNAGANLASGDILCFLHADTQAPEDIDKIISEALQNSRHVWGRFNVQLSNPDYPYRLIAFLMNLRSCISGVATGDQGIFVCRNIFDKLSGYPDIPLMEDIELSKRLRQISMPVCIKKYILITSSRRWEQNGIFKTVILMWQLRLRYFFGTSAATLARSYTSNDTKN